MKRIVLLCTLAAVGCVSATGGTPAGAGAPGPDAPVWPVLTRQHVDLWLHGYAMLLRDTATVPVFRKGYRDRVEQARRERQVSTQLDANRDRLQERFAVSPVVINGQFLPVYFASFDQMRELIDLFVRADGDLRAANDQTTALYFNVMRQSFPTAADREWLRLFTVSLEDERRQFYDAWWTTQNSARMPLVRAADSLWQQTYRARFTRYLNNTQQENGDMILAQAIGGEGRTVNFSPRQNAIVVTLPEQDPREAFYVFAHEAVLAVVTTAVNDNITPAEQRSGLGGRYITAGAVRGGAMLLQRIAPELVNGYTRYYLSQAGLATTGDVAARFATTWPLPDTIRQAIDRQLEIVLGGI